MPKLKIFVQVLSRLAVAPPYFVMALIAGVLITIHSTLEWVIEPLE